MQHYVLLTLQFSCNTRISDWVYAERCLESALTELKANEELVAYGYSLPLKNISIYDPDSGVSIAWAA